MTASCIRHPTKNRFIQLHDSFLQMCQGNHCAALLMAFFSRWHDWKFEHDKYYARFNNIAEMHGDGRPHNQNAYLFFTMEDLIEGVMGLFKKQAINESIELIISLTYLSVHKNPNPRYHFDKTRYFKFYPKRCNEWIDKNYVNPNDDDEEAMQVIDFEDELKMDNALTKNRLRSAENGLPSTENGQPITYITSHNTNIKQSTKASDNFLDEEKQSPDHKLTPEVNAVINFLIGKGMPVDRFRSDEDVALIKHLVEQGASHKVFAQAYETSVKATQVRGKQFGVRYLAKVVDGLLSQSRPNTAPNKPSSKKLSETVFENDYRGGMSWMGDLVS